MLLVFKTAEEQGSCKRTKIVASNFICCSTVVLGSFYCSGSCHAQPLARCHGMLPGCLPPGVWKDWFVFCCWGFFCFFFSQKLQVMVWAPPPWNGAVCESRMVACVSVSSSPACGIVKSCTDSKTSELRIWGAFFSQDHYACTGDFLHFLSSSTFFNNHRSCSLW